MKARGVGSSGEQGAAVGTRERADSTYGTFGLASCFVVAFVNWPYRAAAPLGWGSACFFDYLEWSAGKQFSELGAYLVNQFPNF